jgi:NADH-quinone oxidoreductase subunit J
VSTDTLIFFVLAAVAVMSALGMLLSRSAVYSALFLVLNFLTVAVMYMLLHAAFIAMVQVAVYAGAIMVLFLFVVMLLGTEQVGGRQPLRWQRPLALGLGVVLLIQAAIVLPRGTQGAGAAGQALPPGFGSPAAVGELLFSEYLVPVEVASLLLLAAMVGAIVLSQAEKGGA